MKDNIKWLILGVSIIIAAALLSDRHRYQFLYNSYTAGVFVCDQETGQVTKQQP